MLHKSGYKYVVDERPHNKSADSNLHDEQRQTPVGIHTDVLFVAILGYILVLVLLGFTIYFLYRKVRADKRRRPFRLKQNVHKENRYVHKITNIR